MSSPGTGKARPPGSVVGLLPSARTLFELAKFGPQTRNPF